MVLTKSFLSNKQKHTDQKNSGHGKDDRLELNML